MYLLGFILALLPTYLIRFKILGLPTTLLELLIVVFLFSVVIRIKKSDLEKLRDLGNINWIAGLFVLAGLVSVLVSPEKARALGQLKAFIIEPVLIFYAVVLTLKSEVEIKKVLKYLFVSSTLISFFGIIQYFTFLFLPFRFWGSGVEPERIISVFEHPNELALYLAPLIIFFTALLYKNYLVIQNRIWYILSLITMGVALILTFSRGAWVGVAVGLFVMFARRYSWKALGMAGLFGLLLLAIPPVFQRVAVGLSDPSSAVHFELIKIATEKVLQSPVLGNGLYGFRTTLQQAHYQGDLINFPHNIFLNFWVEMGLLGVLSFAGLIFLVGIEYKKHPNTIKFAAGMFLLTMIIHGLVDTPYFKNDLSVMFWFIIALFYLPEK